MFSGHFHTVHLLYIGRYIIFRTQAHEIKRKIILKKRSRFKDKDKIQSYKKSTKELVKELEEVVEEGGIGGSSEPGCFDKVTVN